MPGSVLAGDSWKEPLPDIRWENRSEADILFVTRTSTNKVVYLHSNDGLLFSNNFSGSRHVVADVS